MIQNVIEIALFPLALNKFQLMLGLVDFPSRKHKILPLLSHRTNNRQFFNLKFTGIFLVSSNLFFLNWSNDSS